MLSVCLVCLLCVVASACRSLRTRAPRACMAGCAYEANSVLWTPSPTHTHHRLLPRPHHTRARAASRATGPLEPCVCGTNKTTGAAKCACPTSFPAPSGMGAAFNTSLYVDSYRDPRASLALYSVTWILCHTTCICVRGCQGKFQLRPPAAPYYPVPRGKSILGVIYGVLLWADMNAATPLGPRGRSAMSLGCLA